MAQAHPVGESQSQIRTKKTGCGDLVSQARALVRCFLAALSGTGQRLERISGLPCPNWDFWQICQKWPLILLVTRFRSARKRAATKPRKG